MKKYYIKNCKSSYSAKNIEASFPKEAFLTVINYTKADEDHDMFWNELNTASKQILQTFRQNQTKSKIIDFQQVQSRESKVKSL